MVSIGHADRRHRSRAAFLGRVAHNPYSFVSNAGFGSPELGDSSRAGRSRGAAFGKKQSLKEAVLFQSDPV